MLLSSKHRELKKPDHLESKSAPNSTDQTESEQALGFQAVGINLSVKSPDLKLKVPLIKTVVRHAFEVLRYRSIAQ